MPVGWQRLGGLPVGCEGEGGATVEVVVGVGVVGQPRERAHDAAAVAHGRGDLRELALDSDAQQLRRELREVERAADPLESDLQPAAAVELDLHEEGE